MLVQHTEMLMIWTMGTKYHCFMYRKIKYSVQLTKDYGRLLCKGICGSACEQTLAEVGYCLGRLLSHPEERGTVGTKISQSSKFHPTGLSHCLIVHSGSTVASRPCFHG